MTTLKTTFIVGCSRSGTSILGDLIAAHPKFMYLFEDNIWDRYLNADSHMANVDSITYDQVLAIRKYFESHKHTNIVEKNPRHIVRVPLIRYVFPRTKIIHIVRDGRDVACSLRSGLCGKTWAHIKPPKWREIEREHQGIIRCAHAWKDIMEIAIRDLEDVQHLRIRYEDLLNDTQSAIKQIFSYLGYDIDPAVVEFAAKIQDDLKNSYEARNQIRWHTDDHTKRIHRWQENMTTQEVEYVNSLLQPLLKYYGYME